MDQSKTISEESLLTPIRTEFSQKRITAVLRDRWAAVEVSACASSPASPTASLTLTKADMEEL
jgi:hypothetical protein